MPFWSKILLKIFLPDSDAQFLIGDIEEAYKNCREKRGRFSCGFWLLLHIIRTLPPLILDNINWSIGMFKNYFKIALRNIVKNKVYSIINITGLAIGLASCLVIFLAIANELSFDKFYDNAENIYRICIESTGPNGVEREGLTPYPMGEALRNDYPDLKKVSQIMFVPEGQINVGIKQFMQENIIYADSIFYDVFSFKFISGTVEGAKDAPNGVVLTESLAEKLFDNSPALGEVIKLDNDLELNIVAVIEDVPANTHLPISMIISSRSLNVDMIGFNIMEWNVSLSSSQTYFVLPAGMSTETVGRYLKNIAQKYLPERRKNTDNFFVQPLTNIHLNPELESFNYSVGPETLWIFGLIGILILVIASINFVNLSTAQSMKRSKEVGVRKALGANRKQVINQLMGEVITYTLVAIVISLILTYLFLPQVNSFLDNNIELSLFNSFYVLLFLLVAFIFVSLLTGLYPSIVISRFSPTQAFRNKIFKPRKSSFSLRNGLVVFQFAVSQILIVGTIIISSQMDFVRNKDLGFTKEQILNIAIPDQDVNKEELLRTKLLQNPQILGVTFGSGAPITDSNLNSMFAPDQNDPNTRIQVQLKPADEYFLPVFNINLLAGENYSRYVEGDTLYEYIINKSLSKKMGYATPTEAIGKKFGFGKWPGSIVGVVEDFHMASLHNEVGPAMLMNFLNRYYFEANVRLAKNTSIEALDHIKASWEEVFPEFTYKSQFFDEYMQKLYEREENYFSMIKLFAGLAVLIGCLGLLGLVSFMAVQRTKEIGLRKVMGATSGSILVLLSKEFTKWVLLANLLAWPVAYYAMQKWLEDYAYRTEISIWFFIIGGVISLVVALITISLQSYKASLANPVESIRTE